MRRPPPPPVPVQKKPPTISPSTRQKITISENAQRLRDEQVMAEVRYYGSGQTNAELDAITAAVVDELHQLRGAGEESRTSTDVEIELIQHLRELLEKLFSPQRSAFLKTLLIDVQRRVTQLFFNSELYARITEASAEEVPEASWPEQALYFALKRRETDVLDELRAIPVSDPLVRDHAADRFQGFLRQLCTDFLSRTTPELESLLRIYRTELTRYFYKDFPPGIGELAWEVIRQSRVAAGHRLGYKLTADRFPAFRETFDKRFSERLALQIHEPILKAAGESDTAFREATLAFVASPQVHSTICASVSDAIYDYLYGEGFLDLPP
ncbi:MAG: hypothetical protein AAGF12_00450, partial [Myxococcota bacterium]